MMKRNDYHKLDFNDDYSIWKGKKREVSLTGWIFDRYNNAFYKTGIKGSKKLDGSVLCIEYNEKDDTWKGSYKENGNIIWEKSVSSDNFGDIVDMAEHFINEYLGDTWGVIDKIDRKKKENKKVDIENNVTKFIHWVFKNVAAFFTCLLCTWLGWDIFLTRAFSGILEIPHLGFYSLCWLSLAIVFILSPIKGYIKGCL